MIWWLIDAGIWQAMEQARTAGVSLSPERQVEFEARITALNGEGGDRVLTVAGDTAEISVQGVLTKAPSFFVMAFGDGNTTYGEIVAALAQADSDPTVKQAVLSIDSPGGQLDGLFDALAAISAFSKPITAVVTGTAASAAFAIASVTDSVEAKNKAVRVGSIGVQATFFVSEDEITLRSTNAPLKNPDPTTTEGEAAIQEELDALHAVFVEPIAAGRGVSVEKVDNTFGRGATLLAEDAMSRGMIDTIAGQAIKPASAPSPTTALESTPMNLQELIAQHPETYALAVAEGNAKGTTDERDRVNAHLTMGEASGDMATALAAVESGDGMTATLNAKYMAAGMKRSEIAARAGDDVDAGGAADNADGSSDGVSQADAVTKGVETMLGIVPAAA